MNESERESTSRGQARSSLKRFFHRVSRWAIGLLIAFLLGAGTAVFTLYRPTLDKVFQTNAVLEQARGQIATLEAEKDSLTRLLADSQARVRDLEASKDALRVQLHADSLYIAVLSVLVDVNGARLALASDDPSSARVYLNKTQAMLGDLDDLLGEEESDLVPPMQKRLRQTLGDMKSDPGAARSDLEVLVSSLTQLKMNLMWESGRERK